jgi:hypothetical protein
MSVPCNCAGSEQRNGREGRCEKLQTDFGELELHYYEANGLTKVSSRVKTFIAEMAGEYCAYEGEVAIKMSVPCNCAGSEQRNGREGSVRSLKPTLENLSCMVMKQTNNILTSNVVEDVVLEELVVVVVMVLVVAAVGDGYQRKNFSSPKSCDFIEFLFHSLKFKPSSATPTICPHIVSAAI